MHITRRSEFMGIWQMHALASILGAQLVSIYLQRGNPVIRKHLHRTLEPRERRSGQTVHIMWTSTREQTNTNCFFPNQFVPLVRTKREETEVIPLDDYSGTYVVVNYDGQVYPGKVLTDDEGDIEVQCMHSVGDNRFFWPDRDDICWYDKAQIVAVIPPPTAVTARYMKVDIHLWAAICEKVNSHK